MLISISRRFPVLALCFSLAWAFSVTSLEAEFSPQHFSSLQGERHFEMRSDGQPIGRMTYRWKESKDGVHLEEDSEIKITMMGQSQTIETRLKMQLDPQLSLQSFDYVLTTGNSEAALKGRRVGEVIRVEKNQRGSLQSSDLPAGKDLVLGGTMIRLLAVAKGLPKKGQTTKFTARMLEPSSFGIAPMQVEVKPSTQVAGEFDLSIQYQGQEMLNRIDSRGELKQETVVLPPRMEVVARPITKETFENLQAKASPVDLVESSRVPFRRIPNAKDLKELKVRISGIPLENFQLNRHRQKLEGNVLSIEVETISENSLPVQALIGRSDLQRYLAGDVFIPVQHPLIQRTAREIVGQENDLWKRARLLHDFVYRSLQKAPYISLPDAIETLETRKGDCNEHATLLTALARAAGIPARMVVGIVHSNSSMASALQGKADDSPGFYYHAWVEVFNGNEWISMDPTWNEVPAGATHIAFIEGASDQQIQLVGLVGRLQLSPVEARN